MEKKKLTIKDFEIISVRDLAYKIKEVDDYIANPKIEAARAERRPNLAFFLGAGASKDSGVILAGEMMKMFKDKIFEIHCNNLKNDKEKAKWLKAQNWYKDGKKEYGCLFEKFRDTRRGRQRFIEEICHKNPLTGKLVEPSFGYVVLADLLLRNYINTVVTTNFDDLVYIASTTFTGNRPIVYAYGILASEMKISDSHSKVLKLHGDFLYSNIVNTDEEMSVKSDAIINPRKDAREIITHLNMERQVRTVLDNFGLIVIGYAGGDKTIMKLLEQISENNGFYWCYIKDYPPDSDVLDLVKNKNGKLVEIIGFDDMMKKISDITNFSIDDLLESFEKRKENLVERIVKFNEDYTKKSLDVYADELTERQKVKQSDKLSAVEYIILGNKASDEGNFILAEENYRKAIDLNPNYVDAFINLGILLDTDKNRRQEAEENYRKAIELNPNESTAYYNLGILLGKDETRLQDAEKSYVKAIELNPNYTKAYNNLGVLILRDKSRYSEAEENYLKAIKIDPNHVNAYYNLACLNSLRKNREETFKYLKKAIEMNSENKSFAKNDADFNFIRDDERFWEIVGRDDEE